MTLDELRVPLRVTWRLAGDDVRRTAEEIRQLGLLAVELLEERADLSREIAQLVEHLADGRRAVSLTVRPAALGTSRLHTLRSLPAVAVLVEVSGLDEAHALADAMEPGVGLSFTVTRGRLAELPRLVAWCARQGALRLVLPMAPASGGAHTMLSRGDLDGVAQPLRAVDRGDVTIQAHDPFLWRALHPAAPRPEQGCQAANTMLYIDADGEVLGCPLLPVSLGNLRSTSLAAIVHGATRRELRAAVRQLPSACSGCGEATACQGGCRGRALLVAGTWSACDPACPQAAGVVT